ncbi:MAG TPA: YbjN domain-containing protein [Acidimicrobiia bacterium]|nr:YbjN domain-containing protein [Acidimicrobiia bacterium]
MRTVLVERITLWLEDEESSVEYAEEVEGRWAVRMRQETRDATTVWFDVGERSLRFEAYVMPAPAAPSEVHRQALVRNARAWRCFFAVDDEGAIVLRGRLGADRVTLEELDRVLGEVFETIEVAFRPMVRAGFPGREKSG